MVMFCESKTWCLREDEMAIFRTERAMRGVKLIENSSQELMGLLGLEEPIHRLAKAS